MIEMEGDDTLAKIKVGFRLLKIYIGVLVKCRINQNFNIKIKFCSLMDLEEWSDRDGY